MSNKGIKKAKTLRKRKEAEARVATWRSLSNEEKLHQISLRPGDSIREVKRIKERI